MIARSSSDTPGVLVGWGQQDDGSLPRTKQTTATRIWFPDTCISELARFLSAARFLLDAFFSFPNEWEFNHKICAGENDGRGTGSGDSGGPLLVHAPEGWIQIGVLFGTLDARPYRKYRFFGPRGPLRAFYTRTSWVYSWIDRYANIGRDQAPRAATEDGARRDGERFRDCETCPELVAVPKGEYRVGSPDTEAGRASDEGPRQQVTIGDRLAAGIYEVTQAGVGCLRGGKGLFRQSTGRQRSRPTARNRGELVRRAALRGLADRENRSALPLANGAGMGIRRSWRHGDRIPFRFDDHGQPSELRQPGRCDTVCRGRIPRTGSGCATFMATSPSGCRTVTTGATTTDSSTAGPGSCGTVRDALSGAADIGAMCGKCAQRIESLGLRSRAVTILDSASYGRCGLLRWERVGLSRARRLAGISYAGPATGSWTARNALRWSCCQAACFKWVRLATRLDAHTTKGRGIASKSHRDWLSEYSRLPSASGMPVSTRAVVQGTGPDDRGWGRGQRPVINVSWTDVQSYLTWLNGRTGAEYRLLSEAEWEYAARAGTTTRYAFGNQLSAEHANLRFNGSYGYGGLALGAIPVGSRTENRFGLHDVHGNVYEWVTDTWHGTYQGAPADGTSWTSGAASRRVIRGGSWSTRPSFARSARRSWFPRTTRRGNVGFRVARRVSTTVTPATPPPATDDHSNDSKSATRSALGSFARGMIESGSDQDYFRLDVPSTTTIMVFTTGSLDTSGTLFGPSNRQLAQDEDSGSGTNFRIASRVAGGTYYVRVESKGTATGSYVLRARSVTN